MVTYDLGIFRCIAGFFLGVFLYQITHNTKLNLGKFSASVIEIILLVATYYSVSVSDSKFSQLITVMLFPILIFYFSKSQPGIITQILELKFFKFLGDLSYSIYMVHAIVLTVAGYTWEYVLKLPTSEAYSQSLKPYKIYLSRYPILINILLVSIIVFISYFSYNYIELKFQKKFRNKWINN
jgi:peptidoglycan/LPS O-acetylase OafA/YrhL